MAALTGSIQYVTGALSLIAFVVAAAVMAYRARLQNHVQMLKTVPAKDRKEALDTIREYIPVDISKWPADKQYDLALAQMKTKSSRWLGMATVALIFGLALAFYAVFTAPANAVTICEGEIRYSCPFGYEEWVPCYAVDAFVKKWGDDNSCPPKVKQMGTQGGNRCGYSIYRISCPRLADKLGL